MHRARESVIVCMIAVSLLCEMYFHYIRNTDVVYTHLFYIPILLAAVWFGYYSMLVAGLLGVTHIYIGIIQNDYIPATFRVALMVTVALIVSYVMEWKCLVDEDIELIKRQTTQTVETLRELTITLIRHE